MKAFKFQQFAVEQHADVFKVGTDGVLLGALSSASTAKNILEVGTGTGMISLMLAQRNPAAQILAIDIDITAARLAAENFRNSPFALRLSALHADFKTFNTEKKFDLIISNPPFFERNTSPKLTTARQQTALSFGDLIGGSAKNMQAEGIFAVIIPADAADPFIECCRQAHYFLIRRIDIYGSSNGPLRRVILEFSPTQRAVCIQNFTIEKSPRVYSDQYLEATAGFHIFKN